MDLLNSSGTAQRFLSTLREVYLRTMLLRHNHLFRHQPQLLPSLLLFLLPSLLLFLNRHHLRPQVTVIGEQLVPVQIRYAMEMSKVVLGAMKVNLDATNVVEIGVPMDQNLHRHHQHRHQPPQGWPQPRGTGIAAVVLVVAPTFQPVSQRIAIATPCLQPQQVIRMVLHIMEQRQYLQFSSHQVT